MTRRLIQARENAGLTQAQVAASLGITQQSVQKWESGASQPTAGRLAALADLLHVSVDYLVIGSPVEAPPASTLPAGLGRKLRDATPEELQRVEAYLDGLFEGRG